MFSKSDESELCLSNHMGVLIAEYDEFELHLKQRVDRRLNQVMEVNSIRVLRIEFP